MTQECNNFLNVTPIAQVTKAENRIRTTSNFKTSAQQRKQQSEEATHEMGEHICKSYTE